jgi:hypothetical protein
MDGFADSDRGARCGSGSQVHEVFFDKPRRDEGPGSLRRTSSLLITSEKSCNLALLQRLHVPLRPNTLDGVSW